MVVAFGGPGSAVYRVLFLLHILSLVVAFAPMVSHTLLLAQTRRSPLRRELVQLLADHTTRVYGPALIAVGLFGIMLVVTSDGLWAFAQGWVSAAVLVWVAMNAVLHGVLRPAERRLAEGDEVAGTRVDFGSQVLTVLLLLMLYLMIWKPGLS